jgi:tRNA A37 threonylcarbamoyladenosine synthetase subunit TsaC/SUA5/YrdC
MPAEVRGTVTAAAAAEAFKDVVGYVLDGGPSSLGMDATVVSFEPDAIVLHRKGAVTARSMEMETHMIVVNSITPIIPLQEEAIVVPFRAPAR